MTNLVRGGFILVALSLFVAIIYAQTRPEKIIPIANDSQLKTENPTAEIKTQESDEKLVKTTGMVRASKAVGASRGSFVATAYCLKGKMANGSYVRRGVVAADPRVLRLN